MELPVLPLPLRRVVRDPIYVVAVPALLVVLAILAVPAWLLGLVARRRRPLRFIVIGMAAVVLDFSIFARCTGLWVAHRAGRRRPEDWKTDHIEVVAHALDVFVGRARRVVGFEVHITGGTDLDHGLPTVLLARHAGVGDSLMMVWVMTRHLGCVPRVVLKRMLLWDPAMDLALRRLGAFFLPPPRVPDDERDSQLAAFAKSAGPGEVILLFPEGRNWTPGRWEAEVEQARDDGDLVALDWMESHPTVLDPHTGAMRTILAAVPDPQVLVGAHRGVERLSSIAAIWAAVPLTHRVDVSLRRTRVRPDDLVGWLRDEWAAIDDWTPPENETVG
ncbi:1-acyl-sn-glycerol-3-phosphate acyltransferase [Allobranchiibius sp. GilTou73]|uniref:1-acyl-sn-glycerol-3-phosphate acyltransferase n=1 Tax=Allobranchiibius sp. GilTou73 TaxID=2904523 RepID=UPI001F1CC329|nr:1-acyl-sn-glycerol-3-phosphate acyltransferase [Allobranchiibius sp. GilTou73]UIJ34215.1 1-acyl-sn-glycerol-3-phosphate acyltransferase [Allobranchiibius sp. GilTou73]